jgi:outer membrane protein
MLRHQTHRPQRRSIPSLALGFIAAVALNAQNPPPAPAAANGPMLTLQQAEQMALTNHPQIQAAQHEAAYSNQQIVINRSAYYPQITGDATGSQGNDNGRIGAGELQASRLWDRFSPGVVATQLITDSGRTPSLVASAKLQAQASQQDVQTSRYDVLLSVNRAYFGLLKAQEVVKVAEKTVEARQLLDDQVTEMAKNQLRSQLDVAEADVTVLQAKQLLLAAQDAVQEARAELGRTLGSDQPANYDLADVNLPPSPPTTVDTLLMQAIANRPELASLRFSSDAAKKFAEAEKDLSKPTVSAVATGGFIPFINNVTSSPIPAEYEGIAANLSIPIFNGHLFAARREAAQERSLEADQKLRDEQERIFRDVRQAWSGAITAYQLIDVTAQLQRAADLALNLANGRYRLQLASIVELTTSQLNATDAQIQNLNAKYDYATQYAVLQYTTGQLR